MNEGTIFGSGADSSEEDQVTRETDTFFKELALRGVEIKAISDADFFDFLPRADGRSAYLVGRSIISMSEGYNGPTDTLALAIGRLVIGIVEGYPQRDR